MDCSLPGFSIHGFLQARILEWVAISQGSSPAWKVDSLPLSHLGSPIHMLRGGILEGKKKQTQEFEVSATVGPQEKGIIAEEEREKQEGIRERGLCVERSSRNHREQ